jgi:hypothetical protein
MSKKIGWAIALGLIVSATGAWAEGIQGKITVLLKNGKVVRGMALGEEDGVLTIENSEGSSTEITESRIKRIYDANGKLVSFKAQEEAAPAEKDSSARVEENLSTDSGALSDGEQDIFKNNLGISLGYLPDFTGAFPVLDLPNQCIPTISMNWWFGRKFALETGLGYCGYSAYDGGYNSSGDPASSSDDEFALTVGGRFVLAQPTKYLLFELPVRLALLEGSWTQPNGNDTDNYSGTAELVYAGFGFEAFIPHLSNVSLEISSGLSLLYGSSLSESIQETTKYQTVTVTDTFPNATDFKLGGFGWNLPFTFAVHTYF